MPVMAAGRTEEETEKRLGANLLTGQPLICIDNVNGELKGDALCQAVERPIVEVRILGKSERVRIEARGVSMYSTGNNIILVGDLCRRVITAVLDARDGAAGIACLPGQSGGEDTGGSRQVRRGGAHDMPRLRNRGPSRQEDALGIVRRMVGQVRSALMWLGEADPVDSIEASRGEDPELAELREMLDAWSEVLGIGYSHRFTLAEVVEIANETNKVKVNEDTHFYQVWPRLSTALQAVAAGPHGSVDVKNSGSGCGARRVASRASGGS